MRNVAITLTNPMPIDAAKGILERINDLEKKYAKDPTSVADVTGVKAVVTGNTHLFIYVFTFTSVMATGTYTAVFEEKAGSTEESEVLNPEPEPPVTP